MSTFKSPKFAIIAGLVVVGLSLGGASCSLLKRVSTDGGVLRSFDSGATWEFRNTTTTKNSLQREATTIIAVDPQNTDQALLGTVTRGLFATSDGGGSWRNIASRGGTVRSILLDSEKNLIYVAIGRGIYKSTNTTDFTEVYFDQVGIVEDLAFDPRSHDTIYAITSTGSELVSTNAGASWETLGIIQGAPVALKIDPNRPEVHYVATSNVGVLVSADGGHAFAQATIFTDSQHFNGRVVHDLALSESAPGTLWAATSYGLFVTTDYGVTFRAVPTVLQPSTVAVNAVVVDPKNNAIVYFSASNRLYKSTDTGRTWQTIALPTSRPINDIVIAPSTPTQLWLAISEQPKGGVPQIIKPFGEQDVE